MRYHDQLDDEDDDGVLDMSIVGDEEEQHRIELEHNLQDLSIQLSLSNPSQASDHERERSAADKRYHPYEQQSESSFELEYPRHHPRPHEVSIFHGQNSSFLDHPQMEQDNDQNYYSYRTVDDDDGVHYVGNTMSTAAHHASAVTLSAGLGGRGGKRAYVGDASLSGAEYDPDRPLDNVMNGMANDLSMLNMNTSRTFRKHRGNVSTTPAQVTFDPLVVNHSADMSLPGFGGRARSFADTRLADRTQDYKAPHRINHDPTPRAKSRAKRPVLNVQPPTPSAAGNATNGSKFTKLARSLAKEIEASRRWTTDPVLEDVSPARPTRKRQSTHRSKARSGTSSATKNADLKPLDTPKYNDKSRSRIINLPDVTGLTSAVGSPPRKDMEWRNYAGGDNGDQAEVQLLQTLTSLQTRLNQLESQNLVSRRRVRELELELEACKAEVKRERTRVLEREEIIVAQQKDFQKRRNVPSRPARVDSDPANEGRYNEVVEEKKALEALIATLRSHLSRLTDELSSQQAQLDELRSLRQCDLRDLRDKISEVDSLRLEVERLGGEVEILRGVVEEGLKERRRVKESMDASNSSAGSISQLPPVEKSLNGGEGAELLCQPDHNAQDNTTIQPFQTDIPSPPPSRPQSQQGFRRLHAYDRTGCAIAGSSRVGAMGEGRFIDEDELERVSAEVEERRSERSEANLSRSQSFHHPESRPARLLRTTTSRRSKVADNDRLPRARALDEGSSRPPRPTGPTPARALNNENLKVETPFPQIRGDRLERLFFSAPEHNAKTCRVCHRRRRPSASDDELDFPSWLPPRKRTRHTQEDGRSRHRNVRLEDADDDSDNNIRGTGSKAASKAPFSEDRLPPQTVLVRILRELEDDFTHYKGIYIELADQYKIMDAASNVPKRNVLAEHLKEVINTLEQKGDQIASLYDLLTFKDKPVGESVVPERRRSSPRSPCSPRQSGMRRTSGLRKYATCS